MRVIVTRPEPSATKTALRLEALGHQAEVMPLFAARHDPEEAARALSNIPAGLIVTSAETARVLAGLPERLTPHLKKPLYAVGEATGRAFAQLGFEDIRMAEGNGLTLAERINREWPKAEPLLYLAGEPRSPHLEAALQKAGFVAATVTLYRMLPVDYPDDWIKERLSGRPGPAILLYSSEAARRFAALAGKGGDMLSACRFYCLSDAIMQSLPAALQDAARAAPQPNEDALFTLLDVDQA